MSYSFTIRAASKAEAKAKVDAEMARVVEQQPDHAADRDVAITVSRAFVDMLRDREDMDIEVRVCGSLGWNHLPSAENLTQASLSASAWHVARPAA